MKFLPKVNFCLQQNPHNGPLYGKQWSRIMGSVPSLMSLRSSFGTKYNTRGPPVQGSPASAFWAPHM